jgi:arylsulfatase A
MTGIDNCARSQDMGISFWRHAPHLAASPPFQPVPLPLLNGTSVVEQPVGLHHLVAKYVDFATAFINEQAEVGKPFYLYVPFNHVHAPNSCSAGFCGKAKRGPIGDAVEEMDWAVGQIMSALKTAGVDDNTLTFFTSDNGAPLGNPNGLGDSDYFGNLPLRGGKAQVPFPEVNLTLVKKSDL